MKKNSSVPLKTARIWSSSGFWSGFLELFKAITNNNGQPMGYITQPTQAPEMSNASVAHLSEAQVFLLPTLLLLMELFGDILPIHHSLVSETSLFPSHNFSSTLALILSNTLRLAVACFSFYLFAKFSLLAFSASSPRSMPSCRYGTLIEMGKITMCNCNPETLIWQPNKLKTVHWC